MVGGVASDRGHANNTDQVFEALTRLEPMPPKQIVCRAEGTQWTTNRMKEIQKTVGLYLLPWRPSTEWSESQPKAWP